MSKKICSYLCSVLSLTVLVVGCGKKAKEAESNPDRPTEPVRTDIEEELEKQQVYCGDDRSCPEYLTKVAFVQKGKLKFCTGFLIDNETVVTSSSCLPDRLRMKGVTCNKDAYFFFSEKTDRPIRRNCETVVEVSQLDGKEPFLWHSDVAYLKLSEPIKRRAASFPNTRTGMGDMDKFYSWSIDQIDAHQGIIRRSEDCQSVHKSYFNPFSNNPSSPVMTISGCDFKDGNSGSPVLDYRGKVRGIISRPIDKSEIDEAVALRILERPLKPLVHVSNFACIPLVDGTEVLNEEECHKRMDINGYDSGQREMMNEQNLFKPFLQRLEHTYNAQNIYVRFKSKLMLEGDFYKVSFVPQCFKDVNKWINTFPGNPKFARFDTMVTDTRIRRSMNEFGRISVRELTEGEMETHFEFNPRVLRTVPANGAARNANLYMWTTGPATTFEKLSEDCSLL